MNRRFELFEENPGNLGPGFQSWAEVHGYFCNATALPSGESQLDSGNFVKGAQIVYGSKGSIMLDMSGSTAGELIVQVAYGGAVGAGVNVLTVLGVNNQSAGVAVMFSITPTINQTLTAGYTALLVNSTETATGSGTKNLLDLQVGGVSQFSIDNTGKITVSGGASTAGTGTPQIRAYGRAAAQTAAVASVVAHTVGAADASYVVSANVNTTPGHTTYSFTVTCAYTAEDSTAVTLTMTFTIGAGTQKTTLANTDATFVYMGIPQHIRCKAGTTITIASAAGGTYTSVLYNIEGIITKYD